MTDFQRYRTMATQLHTLEADGAGESTEADELRQQMIPLWGRFPEADRILLCKLLSKHKPANGI